MYLKQAKQIIQNNHPIDIDDVRNEVAKSLEAVEYGELFYECSKSESLVYDDRTLKNANLTFTSGFGLRGCIGEATSYAHSSVVNNDTLHKAASVIANMQTRCGPINNIVDLDTIPVQKIIPLYNDVNPIEEIQSADKIALLKVIDDYVRTSSPYVKQVTISLDTEWQLVYLVISGNNEVADIRPLVHIGINVVVEKDGRMESGYYGGGGRFSCLDIVKPEYYRYCANEALRQAEVNLRSINAPAGEMPVILGPGWPGILLHEAIGHGLEGDFNRKKTSAFADLVGKKVAAPGVTVIDDGTVPNARGSLSIDDEGTKSQKTTLIEDGVLVGYMHDKMSATIMGEKPTGNGRRESFSCKPVPRMTNTYMLGGNTTPSDIISSMDRGLYAVNFGGGQVDITSGKFVFSATEAYLVEKGHITHSVKGATLIGNGPDVLTKITAIGNDMKLDTGNGTCGKAGQSVPVGVGQPTLLITSMTVGGTEA